MVERQKFTLYQQDMLLGRQKSTFYQHAAREAKTHALLAGYAGREGKNYTISTMLLRALDLIAPKAPRQDKNTMLSSKYLMV